jgi:hypothetical protein
MNKKNGTTVGFIAAAIALLVVAMAVPAGAGDLNRLLTGDYAFSSSENCAEANGYFDAALNRNPDPPGRISTTSTASVEGVTSFDGHGGLTFRGKILLVTHDPGGSTAPLKSPVSQYDVECSGTAQVNRDLSMESDYDCKLYPLAGPLSNNPLYPPGFYMEMKDLRQQGQLLGTMDNSLILRTITEPKVRSVYFSNFYVPTPGGPVFILGPYKVGEQICHGSGTWMKITGQSKK